jgi:hypothetical protein
MTDVPIVGKRIRPVPKRPLAAANWLKIDNAC